MDIRWLEQWERNKRRCRPTAHSSKEGPRWTRIRDEDLCASIRCGVPLAETSLHPWVLIARSSAGRIAGRCEQWPLWVTRRCQRRRGPAPMVRLLSLGLHIPPRIRGLGNVPRPNVGGSLIRRRGSSRVRIVYISGYRRGMCARRIQVAGGGPFLWRRIVEAR